MESDAARRAFTAQRRGGAPLRIALVGARVWLDGCAPPSTMPGVRSARFETSQADGRSEGALHAVRAFAPHLCVVFDACALAGDAIDQLPGVTLGVFTDELPEESERPGVAAGLAAFDRLVSFEPWRSGRKEDGAPIWRVVPPPVSDEYYGPVRPLRRAPRVLSVGRSSAHREQMLLPAKHHHDLLQIIHGVSGVRLAELLRTYDVGVYVAPEAGGRYGQQVGIHLAAGQLLMSELLEPAHGLEVDIDYLLFDSPDGLVWALDRLARFPEMYQRVRARGRMKAEQYRASRFFSRLAHDLLADVAAFG